MAVLLQFHCTSWLHVWLRCISGKTYTSMGLLQTVPLGPLIPSCSWYSTLPYTHHCGTMGTKSKNERFCYHMHINLGILRSSRIFKLLTMWQSHGPITMIHHLPPICHCTSSLHSTIGPLTISRSTVCGGPWDQFYAWTIHYYQTVPHAQTDTQPIQHLACKYVTTIKATPAHYQYTFVTQCWLYTGTLSPWAFPKIKIMRFMQFAESSAWITLRMRHKLHHMLNQADMKPQLHF